MNSDWNSSSPRALPNLSNPRNMSPAFTFCFLNIARKNSVIPSSRDPDTSNTYSPANGEYSGMLLYTALYVSVPTLYIRFAPYRSAMFIPKREFSISGGRFTHSRYTATATIAIFHLPLRAFLPSALRFLLGSVIMIFGFILLPLF